MIGYCPNANNDLQSGGEFDLRMEAKDRSMGFIRIKGVYLSELKLLIYTL